MLFKSNPIVMKGSKLRQIELNWTKKYSYVITHKR